MMNLKLEVELKFRIFKKLSNVSFDFKNVLNL